MESNIGEEGSRQIGAPTWEARIRLYSWFLTPSENPGKPPRFPGLIFLINMGDKALLGEVWD